MQVPRGVIEISVVDALDGEEMHAFKVEEAFELKLPRRQTQLGSKSSDPEFVISEPPADGLVQRAGERLWKDLNSNAAARLLFERMAALQGGSHQTEEPGVLPLFFNIDDDPKAEELPWEVLYHEGMKFLCLDPDDRWPVARVTSLSTPSGQMVRGIEPALKVVLVLGAVGEKGAEEWEGFERAVRAAKLPVRFLVLVSEDESVRRIRKDLRRWDGRRQQGRVAYIGDVNSLMTQIVEFAPNILHFFCHGFADSRPELEVETRADRRADPPRDRGSIRLDDTLLRSIVSLRSLWLIVLNCCHSAKPAPNLHSMAKTLVLEGAPAVVAMRQSIRVTDANLFTANFYASLGHQLRPIFSNRTRKKLLEGFSPELTWMRATDSARRCLSGLHPRVPNTNSEWSYPVLYVHRSELRLEARTPKRSVLTAVEATELASELQVLRAVRNSLRRDMSAEPQRKLLNKKIKGLDDELAG